MAVKVEVESKELRKAFPSIRENCCLCGRPTRFWHKHKTRDCALCPDCALTAKTSDIPIKADWCKQEKAKKEAGKLNVPPYHLTGIIPLGEPIKGM